MEDIIIIGIIVVLMVAGIRSSENTVYVDNMCHIFLYD